jgi:hypothetical protein
MVRLKCKTEPPFAIAESFERMSLMNLRPSIFRFFFPLIYGQLGIGSHWLYHITKG